MTNLMAESDQKPLGPPKIIRRELTGRQCLETCPRLYHEAFNLSHKTSYMVFLK
jgi:hypothetical protein